ncbi:hypothetical protein BOX15_Mlig031917g1 [Macrostomum lignano]|uniref:Uncharacterized protein n=1 Tax=Macrostomum lignano TaxID=282301 RepID=A0A267GWS4_9PLAT|nr:hypothetical protein BOX15_Mlig031917g1 [Macrostomum lignano]
MNSDYGIELQPDDILSLLIDVKSMSDGNAVAEFSVEVVTGDGRQPKFYGASQQIFYKCMASDGDSKLAWFPHLALMNCSLDCNFGASPVALDDRMHAGRLILGKMPARSLQTSEYADPISSALPPKPELHLTVGLPASGKTYYARNLPYTRRRLLLGMDQLIEMTLLPERGITKNMGQEVHTRDRVNYFLYTYGSRIMFMQADEAIAMGCDVLIDQCNVSVYTRAKRARKFVESGYSVALHVLHPTPSIMNDFQSRLVTEFGLRGSETARLQLQANFTLPSPQSDQGVDIQYVRSSRSQLLNGVKKLITEARQAGYPEHSPDEIDEYFLEHCNKLGISIANPFVPSQRRLASHAEALFARLASAAEARRLQQQQQQQQNQKQSLQQASPPTVAMEQPAQAAASAPPVSLGSFSVFDKLGFDTSLLKNVLQSVSVSSASADIPALQQQQSQQQQQQQSQQQQSQQQQQQSSSSLSRFLRNATAQQQSLIQQQLQNHQQSVPPPPQQPPQQQQQQPPASSKFQPITAAKTDEDLTDNLLDVPRPKPASNILFPAYSPAVAGEATSVIERFVEICSVRESKELLSQLPSGLRAELLATCRRLLGIVADRDRDRDSSRDRDSAFGGAVPAQPPKPPQPPQPPVSQSSSFNLAAFTRNSQQQQKQQQHHQHHQHHQEASGLSGSRRSSRRSRSRSPSSSSSQRVRRQQQHHPRDSNSHYSSGSQHSYRRQ